MRDCYNRIQDILGQNTEPYESVELVERYRRYWKPDNVRIILLAESHVFTTDSDRLIELPQIENLPGYPKEYAKFVYCLAYGERNLTGNRLHPKRDGTPQFWEVFYSCNKHVTDRNDFKPILKSTEYEQRLQNKIELLLSLKQNGIWLVDASIVALYNDGGKRPLQAVIRTFWDGYTADVVREANPEHIICIGKDVARILESDLGELVGNGYTVILQPNARLSAAEHMANFRRYGEICCRD
jgi:hypothetical protein